MIFGPHLRDQGTILIHLARQNENINVSSLTVLETKNVQTKVSKASETVVTVVMERGEVKALEALDYRFFYGIRRAHCVR